MTTLASTARFCQRVIKCADKHGATDAANRFHICRNANCEWKARCDGSWKSLLDKSRRPPHHPAEQTNEEYELIRRYRQRKKDDRMILRMMIQEKVYKRSRKRMCRALKQLRLENEEKARRAYNPKPYAADSGLDHFASSPAFFLKSAPKEWRLLFV